MNGYKHKLFAGLLFIMMALFAGAQTNPILGRFLAQENSGLVYLNWQILAGSTCNGIKLYRSVDGEYFTEIYRIDGICGDISVPESYNFVDENPYPNKINYYRLELGSGNFSEIISIEIILIKESSYQIRPNPVIHFAQIYFNNDNHEKFNLILHNLNGQKVLDLSTKEEFFELSAQDLSSGMYIFNIFNPSGQSFESGKIIIR